MHHLDIFQIQHPDRPFHQIHPTTRAVEEEERGVRHDHAEGNPRQAYSRANIQDPFRSHRESAGEEQRITDMAIVDSLGLVRTQTTGLDRFGE
jgi:hypothetical protein